MSSEPLASGILKPSKTTASPWTINPFDPAQRLDSTAEDSTETNMGKFPPNRDKMGILIKKE